MTLATAGSPIRRARRASARDVVELGAVGLLTAYAAAVALALQAGIWLVARGGAPGHFDFAEFWSAGRMATLGHAARAYDWNALAALLGRQGTHAFETSGFPFYYPPPTLLALAPLGLLSFAAAAALWLAVSATAWVGLARRLCPDRAETLAVVASPAVFLCLAVGQTGVLVAVIAGAALLTAPARPIVAGLLLAVLAMKPQTAVLFPLAFLAAGRWRALAACAGGLAGLALLSVIAFGPGVWLDWLHALHPGPGAPAPLSGLGPDKLQSVYGLLALLGAGRGVAMAGQGVCALAAAAWIVGLWRGEPPWSLKAAGLCAAALLASPYSAIYDLPITTVALGFVLADAVRRPLGRVEGVALAVAYLAPGLFLAASFPYGPFVSILLCAVVDARVRAERRAPASGAAEALVTA